VSEQYTKAMNVRFYLKIFRNEKMAVIQEDGFPMKIFT
jgi:hypothetical protein